MSDQEPADAREPMDEPAVRSALGEALTLQTRSLLEMTLLAGALTGQAGVAVKHQLREFVQRELEDTYLLAEKLTALGGTVKVAVDSLEPARDAPDTLARLVEHEHEVVAALHAVISHSGQEPRSEALEHLLEHVIMRKQQQADYLSLALA